MVLAKEGESIGGLPVSPKARDAYLAETEATKEFPIDTIRDFIEALPTKDFTTEEREPIENGFPSLYQSNNDLEEFCIRHKVNPDQYLVLVQTEKCNSTSADAHTGHGISGGYGPGDPYGR